MGFTYVNGGSAAGSGSSTTLAVAITGVNVGDHVAVWVTHEGTATTISVSDGTTTLTQDPDGVKDNPGSSGEPHSCAFYLLASVASGTVTYTATFGAARVFRNIVAAVHTPSAACSFEDSSTGANTGTALSSGNITTTGTDGLAFGANAEYGHAPTGLQINGINADRTIGTVQTYIWTKSYAAGFTGAATASMTSDRWNCTAMAFKIGAGGGATPKLFRQPSLSGIGSGGPFFHNPLQSRALSFARNRERYIQQAAASCYKKAA